MTREEALSKALSTRVHQLEGPQSTWEDKLNILLLVNKREDTLHVIFTAMEEYANQFKQSQPTAVKEEELKKVLREMLGMYLTSSLTEHGFHTNKGLFIDKFTEWLQSRTAVKAEGIEDLEKRLFNASKENAKLIAQITDLKSQPTAGGVKVRQETGEWKWPYTLEGFLNLLKENAAIAAGIDPNDEFVYENRNRTEMLNETYEDMISLCEKFIKSQPSPSNPSIKRPTEKEIAKGFKDAKFDLITDTEEVWNSAINWLLSIQSDKADKNL